MIDKRIKQYKVIMNRLSIQQFAVPLIQSLDKFNFMFESHHRRAAVISFHLGTELGLSSEEMFSLTVAALFHDIGALTAPEKENILSKDNIIKPMRHCVMGAAILPSCSMFNGVAQIIRCHHTNYKDSTNMNADEVKLASHIIHLADRINVLIPANAYVVHQRKKLIQQLQGKVGRVFHPDVFHAFEKVSKRGDFWSDMQNLEIGALFDRIEASKVCRFDIDDVVEFCSFIAKLVDFRSQYTLNHSYTVAHLAYHLGGYFDFNEDDRKKLKVAGYLHDLGYLCIDPRIIEKRGILTNYEANLIKRHVFFTEKMLSGFKNLKWFAQILVWCERHHERVDGSGYPFSLTGESLDTGVKVLAFADSISALMGKRAHRNGLNIETTFDIIKKDLGLSLNAIMFCEIKKHKKEINKLVLSCQEDVAQEYELIVSQIN